MRAPLVVGLDLSFARSAVVQLAAGAAPRISLITTPPLPPKASAGEKQDRIDTIAGQVCLHCAGASLVVMEAGSYGSRGLIFDLGGLWHGVFGALRALGPPTADVPPTVLKKWTTDSGRASKFQVALSIARRYPDLDPADLGGDDEADALALASMGAQHLGFLPWTPTKVQRTQHDRLAWPIPAVVAA